MSKLSTLNPFKKKGSSSYFLAIDIGSDFVKVLIFKRPEENGKLKIVGVGKAAQDPTDTNLGIPTNIKTVTQNLENAIGEANLSLEGEPTEAVVGLSGEMVCTFTTRMRLRRSNPEKPITEKELSKIEHKAQDAALIEACEEIAQRRGRENITIKIINSEITQIEIDGFPATDPQGFKGEKIELSYFTAVAPKNQLYVLESVLHSLKLKPQTITSQMYALLKASLVGQDTSEFNTVILDIGGETTDIAIIFNGSIISSRTLSIGGRDFTRALVRKENLKFSQAEDLKIEHSEKDQTTTENHESENTAILAVTEIWGNGIEEALSEIKEIESLPQQILLCGGGAQLPEIPDLLSSSSWGRTLPFHNPPQIKVINPTDFDFFEDETEKINSTEWVGPLALGYFGNALIEGNL